MSATATVEEVPAARALPPPARNNSGLRYIVLAPPVLYFGLLFVGPLLFLIALGFWSVENFQVVPGFSLANYRDIAANFIDKSNYGYSLAQTLYVAATTAVWAVALCYPMALAIVFAVPPRWQRLVLLLCFAPFWTSYILRVFAWQVLLAKRGIINSALAYVGLPNVHLSILYTQIATRIGLIHYLAPVLIVILYVSITNIDSTLLAAASELGATRMQVLRRVILPLTRSGIVLSVTFAAIVSCGDVLSGSLLGGGAGQSVLGKLPLFANMVIREYASSTNLPHTAALALILVVAMVAILLAGFAVGERTRVEVK